METFAPEIPLEVALSVIRPLRENVVAVGVGVGDDDVVVPVPPQAIAATRNTGTLTLFSICTHPLNG
jgi:hypothetical protein